MPLSPTTLATELEQLFAQPPATRTACARSWADALVTYASSIAPPSTTISAAGDTLATALEGAFAEASAAAPMETAFAAFAATIAAGMAPGAVGTPPPGPVGFAAQFAPPFPETHAAAASSFAARIDTWMRTGTATPPGGSALPWS